ncbi:hypothetical protein FRUB_04504 [Fimbriiglobus ruber]|uniref:Helix-turn-helix domain-containing protein n=2 Tax=Fimbriiglobus ruber TaxID=1908690 RepID=A0A225DXI1_9BACT|nr:hypothetical protein FRUB_04504 [Fimbriiglobus ruber]
MADRRAEIEEGSWGARDRIYAEEIEKRFLPIGKAAELLGCHESTARNVLREQDARFIKKGLAYLYYRPDVDKAKTLRAEKLGKKTKPAEAA